MESSKMPFVAVIGGLRQLDTKLAAEAKAAGQRVGAELARAGFGLVVYFSDEESLEPHVVSGYAAAVVKGKGLIRVRYAESQRGEVNFKEEAAQKELFEPKLFPSQDWEIPFYRSLAEEDSVDAVLLLAGGTSTLIAGQIAVARKLPVLAVDAFGGSAAKIWNQLAQGPAAMSHESWATTPPTVLVDQLMSRCKAAAERRADMARKLAAANQVLSRRNQAIFAALAFALLLIVLFFGMVFTPWPSAYAFVVFTGLIASGATGGLVRSLIAKDSVSEPGISFLLGSIAGLVVGIAYLIPQWVGAPGPLVPKVNVVSANDKIQFASSILVAISAGVGFDTVFARLQKQAQDIAIGPPKT